MARIHISYTLPTTREDGKPLDVSEISHVVVEMSADNGEHFGVIDQIPAPDNEVVINDIEPGTYIFRFMVVDLQDPPAESTRVEAIAVVRRAPPSPVSDVVVTVE
jgi:hypothetical protein